MARIRSIHPGQWTDEQFVSVSFAARLLALGLRNEADDNGVFEWKPITIKMRLFAADNVSVPDLLDELSGSDIVQRFDEGGKSFGAIRNFRRWQRPEKPNSVHPLPERLRKYVGLSPIDPPTDVEKSPTEPSPEDGKSPTDPSGEDDGSGSDQLPLDDQSATGCRKSFQRKEEGGRREEKEGTQKAPPSSSERASERARGVRLPDGWTLSDNLMAWSVNEARAPPDLIQREAEKFRDYWRGCSGEKGRKADWDATWRNWLRRAMEGHDGRSGNGIGQPGSYLAGVAQFAREAGG